MCGIIGYIGRRNVADLLISGLRQLEYRGYDSAGLAVIDRDKISIVKAVGKVKNLQGRIDSAADKKAISKALCGIAHTRWATHGSPTESNAHPHLDQSSQIALVHNGIIENYASIKKHLEKIGHTFSSETDSEVLSHLIGEYYHGNLFNAVAEALKKVEGTFGILVVCAQHPDKIIVARRGSPVVIGLNDKETIVASDVSAIVKHTSKVIYLDDDDIAEISSDGAQIHDLNLTPVSRDVDTIDWDVGAAEKGGYEHFMLKEIFEQPQALTNSMRGRLDHSEGSSILSGLAVSPKEIADINREPPVFLSNDIQKNHVLSFAVS